jgi:hypothetical protein
MPLPSAPSKIFRVSNEAKAKPAGVTISGEQRDQHRSAADDKAADDENETLRAACTA